MPTPPHSPDLPFTDFFDRFTQGDIGVYTPPRMNMLQRWVVGREIDKIVKAVGKRAIDHQALVEAKQQGAVVNDSLAWYGLYDTAEGVRDKTGATFTALRDFASNVEPMNACIETQVRKVDNFSQVPDISMGQFQTSGFRFVMTNREDKATTEDRRNIAELTHFMLECGHAAPPEDETPEGWQRGFGPFLQQVVRDRLTLGWATVRRWSPTANSDTEFPLASFAAVDAALIRRARRPAKGVERGVVVTDPFPSDRTNTRDDIKFVKVQDDDARAGYPDQYTADEMFAVIGTPRSDERANGYGVGEVEQCVTAGNGWCFGRDYNMGRFRMDGLPRGILTVLADLNPTQFEAFKLEWIQMFKGASKRWNLPMLQGTPKEGSGVIWTPIDQNSRDSEYHQWMFATAAWVHSCFGIHPEETGYGGLNPFRPPLAEASPEVKIVHSQNNSFAPLMRWLSGWINREILWRLYPDRRYSFRWTGMGETDFLQNTQVWTGMLEAGMTTTRLMWNALDQTIPEAWADHPAVDLPMPFGEAMQLVMQMDQQAQAQQQAQEQQQAQAQQDQQQQQQQAGPGQGPPQQGPPQGQPGQPIAPAEPAGQVSGGPQLTPGGGVPMYNSAQKAIPLRGTIRIVSGVRR